MTRPLCLLAALAGLGLVACTGATPTPTPTSPPTITPTPTVTSTPTNTPTPTFPADALVRALSLNVRLGPNVRHPAVGAVGAGTPVTLSGRDAEAAWFVVDAPDGTTGWASGDYMDFLIDPRSVATAPTPTPPPTPSPTPRPMDPALPLVLDPPIAGQGGVVVVRLRAPGAEQVVAALDPLTVPLFPIDGDRFAGIMPVGLDRATGSVTIQATAIGADGVPASWAADLDIVGGGPPTETITLTETTIGLLDGTLRAQELAMLATVWDEAGPDRRWDGGWTAPVTGTVSSGFGAVRAYFPGNILSIHTGVDLRGPRGSPVHAAAAGCVVLAQPLTARGNTVIIDHGWGVYSAYFHMDSIVAVAGSDVPAGTVLGLLGSTGMATGPHLHWELRVHGLAVDPLQWLRGVAAPVP